MLKSWVFPMLLAPAFMLALTGCTELPPEVKNQVLASLGQAPPPTVAASTQTAKLAAVAAPAAAPGRLDPLIINSMVDMVEKENTFHVDVAQAQSTAFGQVLTVGTPTGYNMRNRFLNLGVPVTDGLSRNSDPSFKDKLVTLARWDSNTEVRSAGLVSLAASAHDAADLPVFQEALIHLNPGVRFAALEALMLWNHPDLATPLLAGAAEKDSEPLLRVYASAGLARLGDSRGLDKLRAFLDDQSWLVRGMAARYLGEFGVGSDYDLLISRLPQETNNDFVSAEYCVSALKLFAKKQI